jgi:hypothetical protein
LRPLAIPTFSITDVFHYRGCALREDEPHGGVRVVRHVSVRALSRSSTFLWLARRKGAGAGEGSSGLRFDLVQEVSVATDEESGQRPIRRAGSR